MFKLILMIFVLNTGTPTAAANIAGAPEVRIPGSQTWSPLPWENATYPDLASCMTVADAEQAKLQPFNDSGRWQITVQCAFQNQTLCEWLPALYPGGVIPDGNLPADLQTRYDVECGAT